MIYKRKGLDFCAYPGCLSQEYAGDINGLQYCSEHISKADFLADLKYCEEIAAGQGVEFGTFASS